MDKSPDAFRTISEVAEDLDLPQHVLRFWETRFGQIKPLKRGGGRRYYRPDDVDLLKGIRQLLYGQGYTIKGVQRILKQDGPRFVQAIGRGEQAVPAQAPAATAQRADDIDESQYEPSVDESGEDISTQAMPAPGKPRREHAPEVGAAGWANPGPGQGPSQGPGQAGLSAADRDTLAKALAELTECQRVLAGLRSPHEASPGDEHR